MMEEFKRDKTKRSRSEHVKNIMQTYLQKRNYTTAGFQENTKIGQHLTYTRVENAISRPNSILYSCYTNDPTIIDQNFTRFCNWVRNKCQELESLIAPLFCHLYLDILKGGHPEKAGGFFKAHLPSIDKTKCDDFVKDLINLFSNDCDATCMIEQFRSNKYFLELSSQSLNALNTFVLENCHVVILHILQTWFDLQQTQDKEEEEENMEVEQPHSNGVHLDEKFQKMQEIITELEKEQKPIFLVQIENTNEPTDCALIDRATRILAYNQNNIIHVRPIHPYDPIISVSDSKEIKIIEHSKRIYSICVSPDHSKLVSCSEDSTLCIYDLNDFSLIKTCTGHIGPVYCSSIGSNNAYVASGSQDTSGRLWDITTGETLRIFVGHTQAVTCIDFHPNCLYIATGSSDKNIRLWSTDNGSPLRLFHGSKGIIYSIAFSPRGDILASVSDDKKVKIWDIMSAKVNNEFKCKGEALTKLAWSKDGKQICTGALDGYLRVWDYDQINQEPSLTLNVNGKILCLEHCFETFACVKS